MGRGCHRGGRYELVARLSLLLMNYVYFEGKKFVVLWWKEKSTSTLENWEFYSQVA